MYQSSACRGSFHICFHFSVSYSFSAVYHSFPKRETFGLYSLLCSRITNKSISAYSEFKVLQNIFSQAVVMLISNCTVKVIALLTVILKSWVFSFQKEIATLYPCQVRIWQNIILLSPNTQGMLVLIPLHKNAIVSLSGLNITWVSKQN